MAALPVLDKTQALGYSVFPSISEGGWSIRVHPRDHEPPHVHVGRRGAGREEVVYFLDDRITLRDMTGNLSRRELAMVRGVVKKHRIKLLEIWKAVCRE